MIYQKYSKNRRRQPYSLSQPSFDKYNPYLLQQRGNLEPSWTPVRIAPERLQQGLLWDPSVPPHTVQIPGQLLLYTGKADRQSLDSVLPSLQSNLEGHIIALDIRRSEDHDILKGDLYSHLCVAAWNGQLQGVGGGPNCRTWSILRWFPKPGFPKPVRGRKEPDCWGFSILKGSELQDTDNDSLLLLRQLLLAHISRMRYEGPGLPWCFLEHPEDPKLCSTAPNL